jgi:acyl-CoA synthetase (NDP forming)
LFWTFDDLRVRDARALCQSVALARGETWLTPEDRARVLDAFGIPLVTRAIVRSEDEAATAAVCVGYPIAMKVESPNVLHKTDAGAVRLDLRDETAVRTAFRDLADRFPDVVVAGAETTVAVEPMVSGVETLVGVVSDPIFGPLVAFGRGGVETEVMRDVAFRVAPLSDHDVDELMHEVRCFPLLAGHRGRPRADVQKLREIVLRVSLLAQHVPELRELDLNPVIALAEGHGCRVVDARISVAPVSSATP